MKINRLLFRPTGVFALLLLLAIPLSAQELLTLDSCMARARRYYPLIHQLDLLDRSENYTVDNASKGKLPQLSVSGQVTYQSDVTSVPVTLPNFDIPSPTKDQYNLYGEASQSINELYTTKDRIALVRANAEVEKQKTEVDLYKLRDRIHQLYFGILLLDAQLRQSDLLKKDIETGITKTKAAVQNGTAIPSAISLMQAELLKADQRVTELQSSRRAFLDMLSIFIHQPLEDRTQLIPPESPIPESTVIRPELTLFDAQGRTFEMQDRLLRIDNLPRFSLFLRVGVGKPALNFLSEDFDFYYLGGLRINWNLSTRYTFKNNLEVLSLNRQMVGLQRESFLFNTDLTLRSQNAEITKYEALLKSDQEIIDLREQVMTTAAVQLENGIVTPNDYIMYVNAADLARQNLAIHRIQLQLAQYNHLYTTGH